jgi:hypothetical protein
VPASLFDFLPGLADWLENRFTHSTSIGARYRLFGVATKEYPIMEFNQLTKTYQSSALGFERFAGVPQRNFILDRTF